MNTIVVQNIFESSLASLSGSLRANFKRLYITNIMSNITTYIKITGNKLKYRLNGSVSHPQGCSHPLFRNHAVEFIVTDPLYVIITVYLSSMFKSSVHVHKHWNEWETVPSHPLIFLLHRRRSLHLLLLFFSDFSFCNLEFPMISPSPSLVFSYTPTPPHPNVPIPTPRLWEAGQEHLPSTHPHHGDRSSHHSHVELPESSSAMHITTGHARARTHTSKPWAPVKASGSTYTFEAPLLQNNKRGKYIKNIWVKRKRKKKNCRNKLNWMLSIKKNKKEHLKLCAATGR